MAINEAVNIAVNVSGTNTVKQAAEVYEDLGDAVAKTQLEAEKLAQQFGINDARTQEAIKVAGKYKQQMEQLDFAIDGARGGTDQLFRASQGVVAGFEIAAGAAGLFGTESAELEKILLKVQSAMALSQGLKDFQEFLPAIKNVASNFSGVLTKSVQSFGKAARTAIASTGIGLLVVAVGTLVAYWDDLVELVSGVSDEQKDLLATQEKSTAATQEQLDNISAQENILKLQGKSESQILEMKIKATKTAIVALEAQIQTQKEIKKAQVETAERNKTILSGLLNFVSIPITAILVAVDALREAFGQESNLRKGFTDSIANLIFDPKAVAEEGDKAIKESEKKLGQMKNQLAGFQLTQKDNAKKAAEEKKKIEDDAFQKWQDQEIANQEYREKLAEEDFQRQQDQDIANLEYQQKIADEEFEIWQNQQIANQEYKDQLAEQDKQRAIAQAELEQQIFDQSQALGTALINLVGQQSKAGKAIALAQIGADTAKALSGALANSQSPTPDNIASGGLAGILKYITLATTIATNAKRAYDIIQAPAPNLNSSVGGGSAAANVPNFQAPRTGFNVQGEQFTQVSRVYVSETDISNVQNKVKVTESISTL
jgi:hypothetical protein